MQSLSASNGKKSSKTMIVMVAISAEGAWTIGCGAGGVSAPPPPPPSIEVTVMPVRASVVLGNQTNFTASVTNTTDATVSWSVNGVPGGSTGLGTITSGGVYTAHADLPSPATVQVAATSQPNSIKSSNGTMAIASDIMLALTPNPASVELGATQTFQATVTSSEHREKSVRWSLAGAGCTSGCRAVDANGKYNAPQILPSPATALLAAQSVANPSKQTSARVASPATFHCNSRRPPDCVCILPAGPGSGCWRKPTPC